VPLGGSRVTSGWDIRSPCRSLTSVALQPSMH
jgi:hypothetical protein